MVAAPTSQPARVWCRSVDRRVRRVFLARLLIHACTSHTCECFMFAAPINQHTPVDTPGVSLLHQTHSSSVNRRVFGSKKFINQLTLLRTHN